MDDLEPAELKKIQKVAEMLLKAKNAIVLTGAGISTESGIPDFRGENGIWECKKCEWKGLI